MIIGNFMYAAETDTYAGFIATLTVHHGDVAIRPAEKSGDKEPDYRVVAEMGFGPIELGAAWKRTSERGQEFLSVSLDDPALNGPVNAALFLNAEDSTAVLAWNRPKAKPAAVTAPAKPKKAA